MKKYRLSRRFDLHTLVIRYVVVVFIMAISGCGKASITSSGSEVEAAHNGAATLALVGYNYTDRYIDSFSVDGQGGGNINVSSENGGGGGIVCCVLYQPSSEPKTVTVRWQFEPATSARLRAIQTKRTTPYMHSIKKKKYA